ncbi:MND1-interacting protein 1-like [Impatiens glandulifera]|uniref:MND1-interacting protein 1-like n=1 Tax=Impatiens glandulifera TaxID=253017 RepID=UPI001FB04CF7|nr:MND1-interacting protein 1-like [Impatiens glandulifera]
MAKDGRHKNRRPSVPVVDSTSNPNIESLKWLPCKQEEQLDKFIRKKLSHLYGEALSRLVCKGYDEHVALNGLLERGYCIGGEADCLSNVVHNSLQFLTGKHDVESEEQDRPQPFKNLGLLVDFNLHFLVYTLQKYSPNLNRVSILRCILMTDLNLNLAIIMNMPFDMPSDLNLDDGGDDGEKDMFLALESRELLDTLNILDDSVSEDMKDAMIADLKKPMDDLKPQLEKRIRWASKKVAEARRKQPNTITSVVEELRVFEYSLESMLAKRRHELSSANNVINNAEESKKRLEMEKEEIKAGISASKLIESEAKQKCLEVSKKKNWERQKVKLQEEVELEKKKILKSEQELVEIDAAIKQVVVKLDEANKAKKAAITLVYLENQVALEKWNCWKPKVGALKSQTNGESHIVSEHLERLKKLLTEALSFVKYE